MSSDTSIAEDGPAWPSSITLHRAERMLELGWDDAIATLAHAALRRACRCAECESRRRAGVASGLPDDIELLTIKPVGEAGLQFFFSDGHQRGIYPWAYLREIALNAQSADLKKEREKA